MRPLQTRWLGTIPHPEAFRMQTELHAQRAAGEAGASGGVEDLLLLLEHPHVYTIGRRGSREQILWDGDTLDARGVAVVETDRGGMVTYHGPGQLVGYPIITLGRGADLVRYLRDLEEAIIRTLAHFGITGERDPEQTGVWVGAEKIAAIGVRVTRGVTKHGFALNVSTDLSYFAGIVPCGIFDRGVTSVAALTGSAPELVEVARIFADEFGTVFGYDVDTTSLAEVVA